MRAPAPKRDQAYLYWALAGPLGAHAFYCGRRARGAVELALLLAALAGLSLARLRFDSLWAAALALDPIAWERPLSLVTAASPSSLRAGLAALALNTALWAIDGLAIWRWTRP